MKILRFLFELVVQVHTPLECSARVRLREAGIWYSVIYLVISYHFERYVKYNSTIDHMRKRRKI
jgi:hypothetical protein